MRHPPRGIARTGRVALRSCVDTFCLTLLKALGEIHLAKHVCPFTLSFQHHLLFVILRCHFTYNYSHRGYRD
jgi:hypothetical protein